MTTEDPDAELLQRIRDDDPDAFDLFVDRYGDRIIAFGMRVCGEREDARDVAQETLLKAYQSLGDLTDSRALVSWLYRVTSNFCLMRRRKSAYQREQSLEELMPRGPAEAQIEIPDVTHLPEDEAARTEMRQAVREAIATLPAHYRIVLVLRDMEGLSTQEAGAALELPASTIKMRLHRARLMVRNALAERFGSGDDLLPTERGR